MPCRIPRRPSLLLVLLTAVAVAVGGTSQAEGTRTVVDQLGRSVTLPAAVHRVVALQHQTLDILLELGAGDRLVGVLRSWHGLIPGLERIDPALATLPTPGDLTTVNVEALLALHPDVVFVTNYAPAAMVRQIMEAGLPVVAVSLARGEGTDGGQLNRSFADNDRAYAEGLRDGVRLIAEVVGAQAHGERLLDAAFAGRRLAEERTAGIPADRRVRLYMANPDFNTYGTGKYTGVMMARSGGVNVAAEVRGTTRVSMEDVLRWNPQVIFVQDRYAAVAHQIREDAAWQAVDAVREGRIVVTPEYVKPWGYPLPEAVMLGEPWMAKTLYPDRLADMDLQARADAFYRRFYGVSYAGPN